MQFSYVRRWRAFGLTGVALLAPVLIAVRPAAAVAAPAFKSSTTNSRVGVSYLSVAKPSTTAAGDVLLGLVSVNQPSAASVVPPTGWALACTGASTNDSALVQAVYTRVAGTAEPASYKWSFPTNSGAVIGVLDYSGVDTGRPVGACAASASASTSRIVAPPITTAVDNELRIGAFAFRGSGTATPPSGLTERFDNKTAVDSGRSVSASSADAVAPLGTLSELSATASVSAPTASVGIQLSLRPVPDGGTTTTTAPTTTTTTTTAPTTTTTTAPTTTTPSGTTLVSDAFDGSDKVITSPQYYSSGTFPAGGTSTADNPSSTWEGDSGTFYQQGNSGYSGRPVDWGNKYFFRFNTRNFNVGDAEVSWQYRSAPFGQDGYAVEGADATDVWLRYQTQYNLYVWQFDRTNNCIQVKRKLPAQGWTGPADLIANRGVYYTLPTDSAQPIFGAGQFCITWNGVQNLLPVSEQAKPGFPNLAHDSTTLYDFKTVVKNLPNGSVQIQAYRAGVLVYSTTDDGRSGIAANAETQGTHLDRGYYDSVPGWQPSWGLPITKAGSTGFRADNIKFWLDNFTVKSLP